LRSARNAERNAISSTAIWGETNWFGILTEKVWSVRLINARSRRSFLRLWVE
jgi:hypothetical protein